jgi:preprotein translocase subunit SecG
MTAKTKYSRSTWKKKQLQSSMNIPRFGSGSCSLCLDRSIPQYLNTHVSDSQTCADVHLQLALLRSDNAMCAVGQKKYQEICCGKKRSKNVLKPSLGFLAAIFLVGCIVRRLAAKRENRKENRDDNVSKDIPLPMTQKGSSMTESDSWNKSNLSEVEMPTTAYQNMDNVVLTMNRTNSRSCSRSKSRSQNRSRSRGRSQSRPHSRRREQPQSHVRTIAESDSIKQASRSRVTSESTNRSRSLSRGKQWSQDRSRGRSKSRDRQHENPNHRESLRAEYNYQFRSTGHVVENTCNPYNRHEEVQVSGDAGHLLPTQLV